MTIALFPRSQFSIPSFRQETAQLHTKTQNTAVLRTLIGRDACLLYPMAARNHNRWSDRGIRSLHPAFMRTATPIRIYQLTEFSAAAQETPRAPRRRYAARSPSESGRWRDRARFSGSREGRGERLQRGRGKPFARAAAEDEHGCAHPAGLGEEIVVAGGRGGESPQALEPLPGVGKAPRAVRFDHHVAVNRASAAGVHSPSSVARKWRCASSIVAKDSGCGGQGRVARPAGHAYYGIDQHHAAMRAAAAWASSRAIEHAKECPITTRRPGSSASASARASRAKSAQLSPGGAPLAP